MLRLLASRLLKKRLLAAWEAARKWGRTNLSGEPKRDGNLPKDHACRRQQPWPAQWTGISARPRLQKGDPQTTSAAYLSQTGVAKS